MLTKLTNVLDVDTTRSVSYTHLGLKTYPAATIALQYISLVIKANECAISALQFQRRIIAGNAGHIAAVSKQYRIAVLVNRVIFDAPVSPPLG